MTAGVIEGLPDDIPGPRRNVRKARRYGNGPAEQLGGKGESQVAILEFHLILLITMVHKP
jgi:hypothetical protein